VTALDLSRPILVLEAATAAGSVALLLPGGVVRETAVVMGAGTADVLFPAMASLLREGGLAPADVGAVVCGSGPGSFTSLRIAAALAKGLATGVGCPLYAVSSLALAAAGLPHDAPAGRYLVHADALRGERYALQIERSADGRVRIAGLLTRGPIEALLAASTEARRIAVGGALPTLPSAHLVTPRAGAVASVDGEWRHQAVDLAAWEPAYGRLAEAQVKWEETHGRMLDTAAGA
jgi:tRNA threonylcarbamoyladenosine biosynthesis protein TsaB